ncbi:hypothetical protein T4D_13865 [Trichinella pseudospiralis]|uniref:Uncharacterized protein n=1 Tax=Trichinella pseudospiralis TaxID=6337 RepID=A0A0V1G7Q8_TRIPS|nr:hypothetical protein T4D_13865 [Trichinella pseudospiralis]
MNIENVNKIIANFKEPNGYSYKVAYFDGLLMITFHLIEMIKSLAEIHKKTKENLLAEESVEITEE